MENSCEVNFWKKVIECKHVTPLNYHKSNSKIHQDMAQRKPKSTNKNTVKINTDIERNEDIEQNPNTEESPQKFKTTISAIASYRWVKEKEQPWLRRWKTVTRFPLLCFFPRPISLPYDIPNRKFSVALQATYIKMASSLSRLLGSG